MKKLLLLLVLAISGGLVICNHFFQINPGDFFKRTSSVEATNIKYRHELVILNKSFHRDLERSVILYKSFEKYFLDADNMPFFIVVPEKDMSLFQNKFYELKSKQEIRKLPEFLADLEVLSKCGEPDLSGEAGWLSQQVVKLCFGSTELAKNYIMIDSDNYFTRNFDPKILFKNGVLKTFAWRISKSRIEKNKTIMVPVFNTSYQDASGNIATQGISINRYDSMLFIKNLLGHRNSIFYEFVTSPFFFNSDVLYRMKKLIKKNRWHNFTYLLKMIPFEMQWYGEYVLQYENFLQSQAIFMPVNSPDECHPEDGGKKAYGIWFQSVIYDYNKDHSGIIKDNDQLIYKRPAHCK